MFKFGIAWLVPFSSFDMSSMLMFKYVQDCSSALKMQRDHRVIFCQIFGWKAWWTSAKERISLRALWDLTEYMTLEGKPIGTKWCILSVGLFVQCLYCIILYHSLNLFSFIVLTFTFSRPGTSFEDLYIQKDTFAKDGDQQQSAMPKWWPTCNAELLRTSHVSVYDPEPQARNSVWPKDHSHPNALRLAGSDHLHPVNSTLELPCPGWKIHAGPRSASWCIMVQYFWNQR